MKYIRLYLIAIKSCPTCQHCYRREGIFVSGQAPYGFQEFPVYTVMLFRVVFLMMLMSGYRWRNLTYYFDVTSALA